MNVLKVVYVLALATLVAMLIGFGVAAFYEPPKEPIFPESPPVRTLPKTDPGADPGQDPAYQARMDQYNKDMDAFQQAQDTYRRNVFFIVSACGVVVVVAGLLLNKSLEVIRAGLLLGGTAALVYGVGQYFGVMTNKMRFGVIAVAVLVLIYLGYRKLSDRKPRQVESKPDV